MTNTPTSNPFAQFSSPYLTNELKADLRKGLAELHRIFPCWQEEREANRIFFNHFIQQGHLRFEDLKNNPAKFFAILKYLAVCCGGSIGTILGVDFLLFGGIIDSLANEAIRTDLLPKIETGEVIGCFAMTEVGHGSDVPHIETVAIYNHKKGTYKIHNVRKVFRNGVLQSIPYDPYDQKANAFTATKAFIGLGGVATHGVVFAQLCIKDEAGKITSHGPHAFLVPFGDKTKIIPIDMGEKVGLNGVPNYLIHFDGVEIPRENMVMGDPEKVIEESDPEKVAEEGDAPEKIKKKCFIAQITPEGKYEKGPEVDSILTHLYSSIKLGRTYIAITSHAFISMMFQLGMGLKMNPQIIDSEKKTGITPNDLILSKWASYVITLHFAMETLAKGIHGKTDTYATGMKHFVTTLTESVCNELLPYLSGDALALMQKTIRDWSATKTYEGTNEVLSFKTFIDIAKKSDEFKFPPSADPIVDKMQQDCFQAIMQLGMELAGLPKRERNAMFNENQTYVTALSNLYMGLHALQEFEKNLTEPLRPFYQLYRNEMYNTFYFDLVRKGKKPASFSIEQYEQLQAEQEKLATEVSPLLNDFSASLMSPAPALAEDLKKLYSPQGLKEEFDYTKAIRENVLLPQFTALCLNSKPTVGPASSVESKPKLRAMH